MDMKLTAADNEALESLGHKQEHLRTAVRALHHGFDTGLFVHGEGGTGKSFIVEETLAGLGASVCYHNSRLTARGLVDALEAQPTSIHWIEDAETLLDDKKSFGVLRAACWMLWRTKRSDLHWHELLEARMAERPTTYKTRAVRSAEESAVASRINALKLSQDQKVKLWAEETGKGKAAFYRALKRMT